MRSYHVRLPKYDLPLRFRPVRRFLLRCLHGADPLLTVVSGLYMSCNDHAGITGVYEPVSFIANERQAPTLLLSYACHRNILLHL